MCKDGWAKNVYKYIMGKSQCGLDVNMDICLFGDRHSQEQDEKNNKLSTKKIKIDKFGLYVKKRPPPPTPTPLKNDKNSSLI